MSEAILTERRGDVLVVTNNDPATRNSISVAFYEGFTEVLAEAGNDPSMAAVVLTGAGGFFCSGGNMHGLLERVEGDAAHRRAGIDALHRMIDAMLALPKPIIAAVEGGAAGAGVSLMLACDLIIAANDAYASLAYVKIGLTPDGGATAFLSHNLPRQMVAEMALTGEPVAMERLYALGVVNRLVEPGEALSQAISLADRLALGPARSMARIKQLTIAGQSSAVDQQMAREADAMARSFADAEAREGVAAFLNKRPPDFRKLRTGGGDA